VRASRSRWHARSRRARTVASPGRWRGGRRRTGSDSPARLPSEILSGFLEDLPLRGELRRLRSQLGVLCFLASDALLERLIGIGRAGRRRGPQRTIGQRAVSRVLLRPPVGLEPLSQRASHAPEGLRDTAERRSRCRLVQVNRLLAKLFGVVLPGHGSWSRFPSRCWNQRVHEQGSGPTSATSSTSPHPHEGDSSPRGSSPPCRPARSQRSPSY